MTSDEVIEELDRAIELARRLVQLSDSVITSVNEFYTYIIRASQRTSNGSPDQLTNVKSSN